MILGPDPEFTVAAQPHEGITARAFVHTFKKTRTPFHEIDAPPGIRRSTVNSAVRRTTGTGTVC
ncbi:hypothetical protein [Streptomyces niger]|uniref:hypothetical protein n=1 Tax=Streptomyces niger TaxID=66373 RepID=UPI0018FE93BC|nr:hypothetical protein [Streptomyces niger]